MLSGDLDGPFGLLQRSFRRLSENGLQLDLELLPFIVVNEDIRIAMMCSDSKPQANRMGLSRLSEHPCAFE